MQNNIGGSESVKPEFYKFPWWGTYKTESAGFVPRLQLFAGLSLLFFLFFYFECIFFISTVTCVKLVNCAVSAVSQWWNGFMAVFRTNKNNKILLKISKILKPIAAKLCFIKCIYLIFILYSASFFRR